MKHLPSIAPEPTISREPETMTEHCCQAMTHRVNWHCDQHVDPFDCPDALVRFSAQLREYGLIIHDGGTSVITISFCPWCGQRLPKSQRDDLQNTA